MKDMKSKKLAKNVMNNSVSQVNSKDICYSSEDLLTELQSGENRAGFSKEVPFSQGPYLDAPFSQFPNFLNGPV